MSKIKLNISKANKSLIVCGFPGVGKSSLFKDHKDNVSDSDSSTFPKEGFPKNYIDHIKGLIGKKSVILISTHKDVLDEVEKLGVNYIIMHPKRELKEEYIQRYKDRGSPEGFIKTLADKWDDFHDDIDKPRNNAWRVILEKGEYLSDYLK